jgi:hypothetical protein
MLQVKWLIVSFYIFITPYENCICIREWVVQLIGPKVLLEGGKCHLWRAQKLHHWSWIICFQYILRKMNTNGTVHLYIYKQSLKEIGSSTYCIQRNCIKHLKISRNIRVFVTKIVTFHHDYKKVQVFWLNKWIYRATTTKLKDSMSCQS